MNCCDANGNCNQGRDCPVRKERMNSRKHPRTMQEAFGPYTDNRIAEDRPFDWQDKLVMVAGIAAACACALIITVWG